MLNCHSLNGFFIQVMSRNSSTSRGDFLEDLFSFRDDKFDPLFNRFVFSPVNDWDKWFSIIEVVLRRAVVVYYLSLLFFFISWVSYFILMFCIYHVKRLCNPAYFAKSLCSWYNLYLLTFVGELFNITILFLCTHILNLF